MHFILSPFGSSGDVNPLLSLGRALADREHRVTVIVNGYFESAVHTLGLEFEELGTVEDFHRLAGHSDLWKPTKALSWIMREGIIPTMRLHYDLLAAHAGREPIVAVSNLFGFGARVAQEHLGIPLVTIHLQPAVIWSDIAPPVYPGAIGPGWLRRMMYKVGERWVIDPMICPALNAWRRELGLPAMRQVTRWWHSTDAIGCLFPEWFAAPQLDWPPHLIQTDFPLWDEQNDEALPADVAAFLADGEPPIAFTPGSANFFGKSFFEAAVDACRRLERRGMLLSRFPDQIPRSLPPDVRYVPYAPFAQLLPRCAALVHHGGVGSMAQAMSAGIPQLLTVLAHDQFDNAQRVRKLGVGGSLGFYQATGNRLARRLGKLLDNPTVSAACHRLAERLAPRDGIAHMADAIEARFAAVAAAT